MAEPINFLQLHVEFESNSEVVREAVEKALTDLGFELEQEEDVGFIFTLYDFESFSHTANSILEELKPFKEAISIANLFHMQQVTSEVLAL